jgi:hypothetical protein
MSSIEECRLLGYGVVRSLYEPTFRGTYRLHHQDEENILRRVLQLLVTANVVPSSPALVTLMMKAIRSTETSVFTRATRPNIPEDGFLRSHHRENLKSYIVLTCWALAEKCYVSCEV